MIKNLLLTICSVLFFLVIKLSATLAQPAQNIVISQVYGAGGNTNAVYINDYIELFNPTNIAVDISTWSVQYASATGMTWSKTNLSGYINGFSYLLIQQGSGGSIGNPLPSPDIIGTIPMSATQGKIALCIDQITLTGNCPVAGGNIIDFVGYGSTADCYEGSGPATSPSATMAIYREMNGCIDANDNDFDFFAAAPAPRNSASPSYFCFVGIEEAGDAGSPLIISPNPAAGSFRITTAKDIAAVEIFNVIGEKVYSSAGNSAIKEITVHADALSPGIYLVKVSGEKMFTQKLVIE
jgi:hypothetical protein